MDVNTTRSYINPANLIRELKEGNVSPNFQKCYRRKHILMFRSELSSTLALHGMQWDTDNGVPIPFSKNLEIRLSPKSWNF